MNRACPSIRSCGEFIPGCGDGDCAADESSASCPRDCPPDPPETGALIIDHNAANDFDRIPSAWLDAAKALTLHYAHTSHGSQITSGLAALEQRDSQLLRSRPLERLRGLPAAESPAASASTTATRPKPTSRPSCTGPRAAGAARPAQWPKPACTTSPCGPGAGSSRATPRAPSVTT